MNLDAHSNVIRSAIQLSKDISKTSGFNNNFSHPSQNEFHIELQQHMDKVNSHKRKLSMLLASSESTGRIVRENRSLLE